ncbi:MAG: hypothetical protein R2860_04305 [Desulfobacterales bacterium]
MNTWKNGASPIRLHLTRNFREGNTYVTDLPDNAYHVDTSSPETMFETLAQMNARMPMVAPFAWPTMTSTACGWEESLACARMYQADCVIYNGTPDAEIPEECSSPLQETLKDRGFRFIS